MGAIRRAFLPVFTRLLVHGAYLPALTVVASIFATDQIDGFIARRAHTVSALGTWLGLDPSDRVLGGGRFPARHHGPWVAAIQYAKARVGWWQERSSTPLEVAE